MLINPLAVPFTLMPPTAQALMLGTVLRLLRQKQPQLFNGFDAMAGTSMLVRFTDLDRHLFIVFETGAIGVHPEGNRPADIVLSGSMDALLTMAMGGDPEAMLLAGKIKLEGPTDLSITLKKTFEAVNPDWEALLGPMLTRTVVRRLLAIVGRVRQEVAKIDVAAETKIRTHLERIAATRGEVDTWRIEVMTLLPKVDHLDRRLAELERQSGGRKVAP